MNEINLQQAVRLLRAMVAVPSPSFHEEGVGELLMQFLAGQGIAAV